MLLRRPPTGHHLTVETFNDLLLQSEIRYGTRKDGIIPALFRTHNDSTLRILWRTIRRRALDPLSGALTDSNEIGIARVRNYKYAFILPSTIAQYVSNKWPCDLVSQPSHLQTHGYGLAVQKQDSGLLEKLNTALSELNESGFVLKLYRKWWFTNNDCNILHRQYERNSSNSMHVVIDKLWLVCTITGIILNTLLT